MKLSNMNPVILSVILTARAISHGILTAAGFAAFLGVYLEPGSLAAPAASDLAFAAIAVVGALGFALSIRNSSPYTKALFEDKPSFDEHNHALEMVRVPEPKQESKKEHTPSANDASTVQIFSSTGMAGGSSVSTPTAPKSDALKLGDNKSHASRFIV